MAEGMRFLLFCVDTREESFKGVVAEPTILTATQSVTAHLPDRIVLPPRGDSRAGAPIAARRFPGNLSVRAGRVLTRSAILTSA